MKMIQFALMHFRDLYLSFQQSDLTFTTSPFPATGKLDPKFMQEINQRGLIIDGYLFS